MGLIEVPTEVPLEIPTGMRIGARSAGLTMSPDEFDAISDYDDAFKYELIKGVLVVTPMSSRQERSPNELLGNWLFVYGRQHPQGSCLIATVFEEYLGTRGNRRRADRVIWVAYGGKRPIAYRDIATIVVEFVSPGKAAWRRDYIEKRDEYLEAGVVEYWVIDRFLRQLAVNSLQAGKPVERVFHDSDVYRPELLPGFELPLAELFAEADQTSPTDEP